MPESGNQIQNEERKPFCLAKKEKFSLEADNIEIKGLELLKNRQTRPNKIVSYPKNKINESQLQTKVDL